MNFEQWRLTQVHGAGALSRFRRGNLAELYRRKGREAMHGLVYVAFTLSRVLLITANPGNPTWSMAVPGIRPRSSDRQA